MKPQIQAIADIDRVIHEPGRLMIVALLYAVESADFLYLQHETAMNKGTLSSHISRLEKEKYVKVDKVFRGKIPQTLLSLTRTGRDSFAEYRKMLKRSL
jgi:DNA-binding MarR family transcriptional regulator